MGHWLSINAYDSLMSSSLLFSLSHTLPLSCFLFVFSQWPLLLISISSFKLSATHIQSHAQTTIQASHCNAENVNWNEENCWEIVSFVSLSSSSFHFFSWLIFLLHSPLSHLLFILLLLFVCCFFVCCFLDHCYSQIHQWSSCWIFSRCILLDSAPCM